jgi:O-antigen ligase
MTKINTVMYVFFILSGVIKSLTQTIDFPVDITLVTGFYLFVVFCCQFFSGKLYVNISELQSILLLTLLYLIIAFGLFFRDSSEIGWMKLFFSLTNLMAFVFPIFSKLSKKTFFITFILLSLIFGVINFYVLSFLTYEQLTLLDMKAVYLSIGLVVAFALILNMHFQQDTVVGFILFAVLFFLLLVSSARGPLIFYIVSIFMVKILFLSKEALYLKRNKLFFAIVSILLLSIVVILNVDVSVVYDLFSRTISRMTLLFADNKGESIETRYFLFEQALSMFNENIFFGGGFGSFGAYVFGENIKLYPHNLILELASETGLLGVSVFIIFVFNLLIKNWNNQLFICVLIFSFLNLMKSYSFQDIRLFFGLLSVSIAFCLGSLHDNKSSYK